MLPADLRATDFQSYPPLAYELAIQHLSTLRQVPLTLLSALLKELIEYDLRFPAERADIVAQLDYLGRLSPQQLIEIMLPFARLPLPQRLYKEPWVAHPAQFIEKLTAYLWEVQAIDAFHQAAKIFGQAQRSSTVAPEPVPRWCFVVVGRGAHQPYLGLFQQLRSKGTLFTQVDSRGGWEALLTFVKDRAVANPKPYTHWYVDGDTTSPGLSATPLTTISYRQLGPVRDAILRHIQESTASDGGGPEELRTLMAQLRPADLEAEGASSDAVLESFKVNLLTEGSGTQIFSTTFVQWAGREILRRAQPETLLMRYAPRQEGRPMNDLLDPSPTSPALDAEGSLVDASMGALYTWLNLQRLSDAADSHFLAWRESGQEAVIIAPGFAQNASSHQRSNVSQLLRWMI